MDRRKIPRVVLYRAQVPDEDETYEVRYEALADALHFACRDLRAGRRAPLEILEDGELVMDSAQIARHCAQERHEVEELIEHAGEGEDGGDGPR